MNKRLLLARTLVASGLHRLASSAREPLLFIFNYHRIRSRASQGRTAFDDGVFGPDEVTFRQQIEWLQAATIVLDEEALLELPAPGRWSPGAIYSAVTFDDAYVDCYSIAKPILDSLGVRALFFIPVDLIESRSLGWWDQAAYMLKRTTRTSITLGDRTYDLAHDFRTCLRGVLDLFKLQPATHTADLLIQLADACRVAPPAGEQQSAELLTWEQIRELHKAGHAIGSHTMSHRVLATLTPAEQALELRSSRRALEAVLGCPVVSLAYPVGGPQHINQHSVALARETGYAEAFTFNTGFTGLPSIDVFQVPRESANTLTTLRCKVLAPRVMGLRKQLAVAAPLLNQRPDSEAA